jgi:hypothetical protein
LGLETRRVVCGGAELWPTRLPSTHEPCHPPSPGGKVREPDRDVGKPVTQRITLTTGYHKGEVESRRLEAERAATGVVPD